LGKWLVAEEGSNNMYSANSLETGVLYCGDNLKRLAQLPSECVDLIYLDPPFFSNRNYEVIWGDEAEVRSFEDRWEGGINHYIEWMWDRVIEMHRVLKPTGSIYLHCDWHASHYLKVMMDDVFGARHLRNEIIWYYESGGRAKTFYPRKHDTIFWYSKSNSDWTFNKDAVSVPRNECGSAPLNCGQAARSASSSHFGFLPRHLGSSAGGTGYVNNCSILQR
jgi:DNA modification methylase